jgi:polyisoprenoid-binding protein YceI
MEARGLRTFYVDNQVGANQVSFTSQAPLEDFTGVCNRVNGEWQFDPKAVEQFSGRFSIRVEDMGTGLELRDTHMRGPDWLNAAEYPEITVEIVSVEDVKKIDATNVSLTLVGTCTLHGKSAPARIPATLAYLQETPTTQRRVKGDLLRVRAQFTVKLSDHGVTGPKASDTLGLTVADEIEIRAAVFGSTEPPPKPLVADKPAGMERPGKPAPPEQP